MTRLAILGGGPAGYVAALRARQLGAEVTLVEMDRLGGVCTNRGCIPSKTLLRSAEIARLVRSAGEFGVQAELQSIEWQQVMARKQRVVDTMVKGIEYLMDRHGVRVVKGRGRLVEPLVMSVETEQGTETIRADRVLLCPGSIPARLPVPGAEGPGVMTSDQVMELPERPESLAIIGGGYIGAELADFFDAMGTRVAIVEMLPRLLPQSDEEMSAELARAFRRRRISVSVNARVTGIERRNGCQVVHFTQGDEVKQVEAQAVLQAVGRVPNTEGIGLAEVGVEMDGGKVKVNNRLETSVPGVYACGDAIGRIMLAHVGSAEGKVAAANALGQDVEMDYTAIPTGIYTHPEIGSTGLTEAEARDRGFDIKVGRFHFRAAGKAVAEGEREGLVKIIADAKTGRIIGSHIAGPHATDLIHEVVLALKLGATAEDIGEMVHAHPTFSEPIMEAAEDALGVAIHK